MNKYKYLLFDFDGTLVDSKAIFLSVYNQMAEKYKHELMKQEDIEILRRMTILERCKYLKVPLYKLPSLVKEFYPLYKISSENLFFFKGIKELLLSLQNVGYKVVILSSNKEENIRGLLEKNNIDQVSQVFCSHNIFGKDKMIRRFLRSHHLNPDEVLYIGDEHRDVQACKKCGVKIVWVGWGFDSWEMVKAEKPDFKVEAPEEIWQLLK